MDLYQRHQLKKLSDVSNEYELILYLDNGMAEFSNELGERSNGKQELLATAKQIIKQNYPSIKVTTVKIIIGGMMIAAFPFEKDVASANTNTTTPGQVSEVSSTISYRVLPGDTLWILSRKFDTSVADLKNANKLTSDALMINQSLVIPKGFHTVISGDSLSVLARNYNSSVSAIKEVNNLPNDQIRIGQTLIIPMVFGGGTGTIPTSDTNTAPAPAPVPTGGSYTVVTGDSLSVIAKRFQVSVDALRSANQLTSDMIRIGQVLTIPTGGTSVAPAPVPTGGSYTVVAGDSLSVIAKRFQVSVDALRSANQLTSDMIRIGQVLIIPTSADSVQPQTGASGQAAAPITTNQRTQITHTVQSGDNIWNLSIQYGIPQSELLKENNLTLNSALKIGQKLNVPVYNIAVQPVVSAKHGEHLDWWTEAQYVVPINKTFKVTDVATGKSFNVKRTIGANHADSETLTVADSEMAKSIWGGYSWKTRAVIIDVDGRKIAASMSFMPHDVDFIKNNGITGHFDIHFKNSTRHKDGAVDPAHQAQINIAAGVK